MVTGLHGYRVAHPGKGLLDRTRHSQCRSLREEAPTGLLPTTPPHRPCHSERCRSTLWPRDPETPAVHAPMTPRGVVSGDDRRPNQQHRAHEHTLQRACVSGKLVHGPGREGVTDESTAGCARCEMCQRQEPYLGRCGSEAGLSEAGRCCDRCHGCDAQEGDLVTRASRMDEKNTCGPDSERL